jgi:hypothetical protein
MRDATERLKSNLPNLSDITECLDLLADLAAYVELHGLSSERWRQELFVALKVHPVAHRLLSIPRYMIEDDMDANTSGVLIREMLRLAGLIFAGLLKGYCHNSPTAITENQGRLVNLLKELDVDWSLYEDLHLWVLTIAALTADGDRNLHVSKIASLLDTLGMAEWYNALEIMKQLIWVGSILDEVAANLGVEVEAFRI